MKSIFYLTVFIFICNFIIDYLEQNKKIDEGWRNSISVTLIFLSIGYFCFVVLSMII